MCKYCNKLKELKDLDEKSYKEIINSWRRHVYKADVIMNRAINCIQKAISSDELTEEDVCDLENCVSEMSSWRSIDYV